MSKSMKNSEILPEILLSRDVTKVFAMSGANNEELLSELEKCSQIELTIVKNEYNAIFMAMSVYLKTNKLAAVITTSGAAILNTLPAVAEAFTSQIPLLVIGGQIDQKMEGVGAFQDNSGRGNSIDVLEMFKPATISAARIERSEDFVSMIEESIDEAIIKRAPSVLLIPKNIVNAKCSKKVKNFKVLNSPIEKIDFEYQIDLIILGEELLHLKDKSKILSLIKELNCKVATTPLTKGLYDNKASNFIGVIGVMGNDSLLEELPKAKTILLLGTNWDVISRFEIENKLIDKNILSIGSVEHFIFCKTYKHYNFDSATYVDDNYSRKLTTLEYEEIDLSKEIYNWKGILHTIDAFIENDADLFIDAGNTGAQCVNHLSPRGLGSFHLSLGQGGMGNSFGSAIGCSTATKKRSYIFTGDGSFLINGLEIHTAVQKELPLAIFIFNNNSHGMCRVRENIFLGGQTQLNNFEQSNYAAGMKAMFPSILAYEVHNQDELLASLKKLNENEDKIIVININIQDTEVPPFRTFTKSKLEPKDELR
ncbi:thiamine pyrophosphate-binding protein [Halobacteriovorax sp. HLS]|uniref:thiamine pyrophosphate-binding protein n=1 Tax=Halobacteriovorax sp. HLS TaxID=2234000 RepID=UPI000FDC75E1|nr:thiamine pyrophosphate-binding protein [Halobacteriovorax sp. HLS]